MTKTCLLYRTVNFNLVQGLFEGSMIVCESEIKIGNVAKIIRIKAKYLQMTIILKSLHHWKRYNHLICPA